MGLIGVVRAFVPVLVPVPVVWDLCLCPCI